MCAKKFIINEPFVVLLGDDIVVSKQPCTSQMISKFEETNSSINGVQEVSRELLSSFGVISYDINQIEENLFKINDLIEKPKVKMAPSNYAIMGRYVLTPEVLDMLENTEQGSGSEIQLTDALKRLLNSQDIFGYLFEGKRYDIGNKLGFI